MPPVPPPPPPLSNPNSKSMDLPNTAALLKSIERGTKLKKTVTHDRSAPIVSSQPNSCAPNKSASSQNLNSNNASSLGGLFANGFPALRSTKSSGNNNQISFIKKPVEHATTIISRNPEQSSGSTKSGIKILEPIMSTEVKMQGEKLGINSNSIKKMGQKLGTLSISIPSHKSEWIFDYESENELPTPRKFSGCKKNYLSQGNGEESRKSKSSPRISEDDIQTFVKTLNSKLKKAAREENFEECVRLKKKINLFESIEKRIKSGDPVFADELPK